MNMEVGLHGRQAEGAIEDYYLPSAPANPEG
jgi:hypothetical protein